MSYRDLVVPCLLLVALPFAQERIKPGAQKEGFLPKLEEAGKAWKEKRFGACIQTLQECLNVAVAERADVIRAALPGAPAGYTKEADKQAANAGNPFAAAMTGAIGSIVEQRYREQGGQGRIDVTVNADSPMVQMVALMFANPAAIGPDAELVKYGDDRAILKTESGRLHLQILIDEAHLVEVRWNTTDDEALFEMFDQEAVDALAKVLGT